MHCDAIAPTECNECLPGSPYTPRRGDCSKREKMETLCANFAIMRKLRGQNVLAEISRGNFFIAEAE
jgi:hypothetical protein